MKIRATIIHRYHCLFDEEKRLSGRLEINWSNDNDEGSWLNLGVSQWYETDWQLVMSLMILGGRKSDIEVEVIDLGVEVR